MVGSGLSAGVQWNWNSGFSCGAVALVAYNSSVRRSMNTDRTTTAAICAEKTHTGVQKEEKPRMFWQKASKWAEKLATVPYQTHNQKETLWMTFQRSLIRNQTDESRSHPCAACITTNI